MADDDALAIDGPERPGIGCSDEWEVVIDGGVEGTGGKVICCWVYGVESTYRAEESM